MIRPAHPYKPHNVHTWQDVCKPGESSPSEGKWFAAKYKDGHQVASAGPFDTEREAIDAVLS